MATVAHTQTRIRRPARPRIQVSRVVLALALVALFGRGLFETVVDLGSMARTVVQKMGGCL